MSTQVLLELPDHLYARARELAAQQRQDVAGVLTDLLQDALASGEQTADPIQPKAAMQREINAYIALHPSLVANYLGRYVAIFQGELIDHDSDFGALIRRVESSYPDDFVLVRRVEHEPTRTITIRSPRLLRK